MAFCSECGARTEAGEKICPSCDLVRKTTSEKRLLQPPVMAVGSIASVLSVSIGAALIVAGLYDARPALTGVVSSSGSIFVFAGMALLWREQRVMLQKWAVVTFVFTVVLPIGLVLSSQSLTEIKPAVVPILWLIVIEIFLFSGILLRWKLRKNPAKSATEVAVHLPGDKVS